MEELIFNSTAEYYSLVWFLTFDGFLRINAFKAHIWSYHAEHF